MPDSKLISSWFQPQHLLDEALKEYRAAFAAHPAHMLILRRIFRDEVAAHLSHFIAAEAQFETLFGLYSKMQTDRYGLPNVTEEEWVGAAEEDHFFKLRKFVRVANGLRMTPSLATFLRFQADFNRPGFKELFEEISGLNLEPKIVTLHLFSMQQGDCLDWHDDTDIKYQLAFIFYLSQGWQPEFGGALHMLDPIGNLTKVEVEYNSLVIFEVNSKTKHRVAAIEPAAGKCVRATISGWLHKPEQDSCLSKTRTDSH